MLKKIFALPVVALGLVSIPAFAWGPGGHMAAGTIADQLLAGTKAAKQARKILGSNLRTASVWADCAKGVNPKTFKYENEGMFPECAVYENAASEKMMESFVRRNVDNCTSPPHNTDVCHRQYHYTDVAMQRTNYKKGLVGTSDQDIVGAVSAAIAVLQDKVSPAPFKFASKKEALRVLAHYVGDIHQPLHVAAVYVDAAGHVVDPDMGTFDPQTETRGGNDLLIAMKSLHAQWDSVTGSLTSGPPTAAVLKKARSIPVTAGSVSDWSAAWASETIVVGRKAFDGITYSAEDTNDLYRITLPAGYDKMKSQIQGDQVIKAGARLAQILRTIWPD